MSGELEDLGDGTKKGKVYVPLYAAEVEKQNELKRLLKAGKIKPLNQNKVMFPTYRKISSGESFEQKNNSYFEYEGELYLLLEANMIGDGFKLSNNGFYRKGDSVFIKVEETDLYMDEEKKRRWIL